MDRLGVAGRGGAGLAAIVADRLSGVGLAMQAVTLGVIAFNESVDPILFRRGLERAGEISRS